MLLLLLLLLLLITDQSTQLISVIRLIHLLISR